MMIRILLLVFGLVEVSLAQVDYATLDCNDTVTIVVNATKLNLNASNLVITKSLSESESTWCRPLMRGGIDPNAVEFQIRPVNGCLPVIKETTVYINYTWTVWVYNGGLAPAKGAPPILRYKSFCLKFSCCFANKYNLTAPYVIPMIEKVTRPTIMKQGKFQFKLGYFDQAYGGQLKNPVNVLVPNRVYLKIWMNVFNPNIVVKLLMCWATPDNNPENMKRYSLIMDGKAVMNQGDPADAVVITKNCKPGDARFNFMSFVWVPVPPPAQMIFVHCMVKICNTLVPGNNCTTNATAPSGRKRRDVIGGNSDVIEDQHEVVSSGPIIFHQPVSPCKVNYCTMITSSYTS
uniref:zona pellucida sperm-binding protein 2 isoform X2 n=1 Tax=Ciona intestinalis TaxID=7719 RepID=UPI000EF4D20D|nr:zona pellucida sperm-binding protein 2 isoform X2 [Ciona intestinalis]|eukprot:XP_026696113.1 zona pellucida sperm-binding protein 2 isoform X2 [Ciona intestinalis]